MLKYKFGKTNRASRTSEILINKYLDKLKTAKPTPSKFQPKIILFNQKKSAIKKLQNSVTKLTKRTEKFSEKELDFYILPHPLLGKLTLRELLYFTDYHVLHHLELIKKSLTNK